MIETAIKEDLILDKKLIIPKNKLDAIRIMNELHPVVGGQPTHEKDQPNDNNPILDLACTLANIHASGVGDVADLRKIQNEPPSFFFEKGAMWGISSLKGNGILHVIGGWRDKSGLYAMMQFYYTTKEIVYRTAETEEKWGDWISVLTNESNIDYNKLLNVPITSTLSNDKTKISSIYAVNLVNTTASNAQKTANTAVANAKTADGKAVAAQSTANTAVTNAKTADGKAVAAQNTANTAVANAKTADGKAVAAQSTANTAVTNAKTADGKAVAAQSTANTAVTNAKTADGKAVAAQNTANTAVANAKTADGKAVAADKKAVDANNNANKRALKTEVMLALGSLGTKNLNDVTAPGNYFQTQNSQATTARNYPKALAGNLFVLEATGGATDCIQLYITYSTNKMFVRNKYGTTWSKWKESAEETDVVAAKKRADDAFKRVKPITEGGTGATTAVNARKNLGIIEGLGHGQKWVDVTNQRTIGSKYTNNTGRPIQLGITFDPDGTKDHYFFIDGISLHPPFDTQLSHIGHVIPAGSTYQLINATTSKRLLWAELR